MSLYIVRIIGIHISRGLRIINSWHMASDIQVLVIIVLLPLMFLLHHPYHHQCLGFVNT